MEDSSISAEEMEAELDQAIAEADELHKVKTEEAQLVGALRDRLAGAKPAWITVAHHTDDYPEAEVWVQQAIDVVSMLRPVIRDQMGQAVSSRESLELAAGTAASFASTGYAYWCIIEARPVDFEYAPLTIGIQQETAALCSRLAKLDPNLGLVCEGVREALYGTRSDAERAALAEMRQTLDYFFDILAPENDVRGSEHWQPKLGDKPMQVYRAERIAYAAAKHVKSPVDAENLVASTKQVRDLYQELNRLHTRGKLEKRAAREAVAAGERILTTWADALGL